MAHVKVIGFKSLYYSSRRLKRIIFKPTHVTAYCTHLYNIPRVYLHSYDSALAIYPETDLEKTTWKSKDLIENLTRNRKLYLRSCMLCRVVQKCIAKILGELKKKKLFKQIKFV